MSELKIIETVGDSPNAEFGKWYEEKVRETAKFFVRNVDPGYLPSANSGMTVVGASLDSEMTFEDTLQNSKITIREKEPVAQ